MDMNILALELVVGVVPIFTPLNLKWSTQFLSVFVLSIKFFRLKMSASFITSQQGQTSTCFYPRKRDGRSGGPSLGLSRISTLVKVGKGNCFVCSPRGQTTSSRNISSNVLADEDK